jgi:hypothetical protein
MAWRESGRIQRPRAWAAMGPYRELVRGRGMGELGATQEEATAFAGWRGPLASE